MEKYRKQPAPAQTEPELPKQRNEIRVSAGGKVRGYITAALKLLQTDAEDASVVVYGKGAAINKAVSVAEIVKRNMKYVLHQYNTVGSIDEKDIWDPVATEQDLDRLEFTRHLPYIKIVLSKQPLSNIQYQGYTPPGRPTV
ncbi:hypothetical protein RI367_003189 [Sorochytrium milnesiophthora]